ncbi:MAG: hypothetical protein C3F02_03350 [Parcubacteria group bacterium]|nr:MAG: hypothetical protein C3F02_03350 [Parcubacteria group bacterium]
MNDRKLTIILLIILALSLIGGGWWLFTTMYRSNPAQDQRQADLQRIDFLKNMAADNVRDFLVTEADPGSIWVDLAESKQFASLKEIKIDIPLDKVGNSEPFFPIAPPAVVKE